MPRPARVIIYRAKCLDCKYEWTSRRGSGIPEYCPKCRSRMLTTRAMDYQG
jgi:predicted Zn-ribbon and HTH transcriptional regulator